MLNKIVVLAFICIMIDTCSSMLRQNDSSSYQGTSRKTCHFSIPKDPYPSNTLVYKLKGFVKQLIQGTDTDYCKVCIKEIVNEDLEENSSEDLDHLNWVLLYCTPLADNSSTSDFYEEIEHAITERSSI